MRTDRGGGLPYRDYSRGEIYEPVGYKGFREEVKKKKKKKIISKYIRIRPGSGARPQFTVVAVTI